MSLGESVTVSVFDLFVPVASLRLPALVMLTHDMVHTYGAGNVVCQQLSPGP